MGVPDTIYLTADGEDSVTVCVEVLDSCGNFVGDENIVYFDVDPPWIGYPLPATAYVDSGRACIQVISGTLPGIGYIFAGTGDTFSVVATHPIKSEATGIIDKTGKLPGIFALGTYPNPFNSAITIVFRGVGAHRSGAPGQIAEVEIFDINGRLVGNLPSPSSRSDEGPTPLIWRPDKCIGSGIYLFRVNIGDESVTKRVVYLK